jgi:alpha-beta hydrolase superfamily lysophospholipase
MIGFDRHPLLDTLYLVYQSYRHDMDVLDMTALHTDTIRAWDGPAAIAPRGTLIVIPGRGEHADVYERFGRRLAFDGYQVRAVADPIENPTEVAATVEALLADDTLATPRVLVGSDTGALFAIRTALNPSSQVDGLVLVGLPVPQHRDQSGTGDPEAEWSHELEERTACPTHRARLSADTELKRGALSHDVPADWFAHADLARVAVPVLGLHGEIDSVSPLRSVRPQYVAAPTASLVAVAGGRHDALNDATHRTAAATVVLFLERLKLGRDLPAIARVEV